MKTHRLFREGSPKRTGSLVAGLIGLALTSFAIGCAAAEPAPGRGDAADAVTATVPPATPESEDPPIAASTPPPAGATPPTSPTTAPPSTPFASTPNGATEPSASVWEPDEPAAIVALRHGLRVQPAAGGQPGFVELDAVACLDAGWLEQVACGVGTREHESLVVIDIPASDLHAALLLAGFEPGQPGRWSVDESGTTRLDAPVGDALRITFRWRDDAGVPREASPRDWIISEDGSRRLPDPEWRFGGSRLVNEQGRLVEAEADGDVRYLADLTGSIIGLVTFGDEVVGFAEVIPDASDYAEPAWMVDPAAVPPPGTPVQVVLERAVGRRETGDASEGTTTDR